MFGKENPAQSETSKPDSLMDHVRAPLPKYKPELISPTPKGNALLDFIAKYESSDNYNVIYGGEIKPLTKMTIKEIYDLQDKMIEEKGSSALGRYQFLKMTLKENVRKLGIDESSLFDEQLQDQIARSLLEKRGFEDYKLGKITTKQIIRNLSKEWAALSEDETNTSRHKGVLNNKALVDFKTIKEFLERD